MTRTLSRPKSTSTTPSAVLPPWLRHTLRTVLHFAADALAVAAAYRLAYLVRFDLDWLIARFPIPGGAAPPWSLYERILPAVVPLWLLIFWYSSKLYSSPWMTWADRFLQILKGCLLGTGATLVATYIYGRLAYSRMMLLTALPIAAFLVTAGQTLVLWIDDWMSRHEAARPVILVGTGAVANEIIDRIRLRHPGAFIQQLPELPELDELDRVLSGRPFYELILLRSSLPHARILEAAEACESAGTRFRWSPTFSNCVWARSRWTTVSAFPPTASSTRR